MPHTSSAAKRLRQDEKRRFRNRAAKKSIKVQTKTLLAAVKDGDADAIKAEFKSAIRKLDKAAAKGVVHRNMAARKISQFARLIAAGK